MPNNLNALLQRSAQTVPTPASPSDDDEIVGPLLPSDSVADKRYRSPRPRPEEPVPSSSGQTDDPGVPKRGDWMLVPPTSQSSVSADPLNIKNRQFNVKGGDRITFDPSWLATPSDAASSRRGLKRSKERSPSPQPVRISKRDAEVADAVAEYNAKFRSKSLLEEHLEKKAKEGKADRKSRGPKRTSGADRDSFDRERDMATSKVDLKRQKQLLSDTGYLSSKYGRGRKDAFL
ncbi:hypothetical protein IWQ60_012429 [Tieghemiomyces parasiticus]|uniref:DUF3752 domain-containing protein n=1 Tax=Tieghemiomyces parasiticus TaxID=78921 RepID=A0A9W7ZM85_9FUNG|nr:hypothetical protein IWQ60_012429 [Tieghemiomyces parasiticus]